MKIYEKGLNHMLKSLKKKRGRIDRKRLYTIRNILADIMGVIDKELANKL